VRGRFHMAHVGLTKFFDILEHVVQLLLKNFRLGFSQIYSRQPSNVRDVEVGSSGHDCRSRMQMTDEPHDSGRKGSQKKEKNDSALPSHFAQRTRSSRGSACIQGMFALQR